MPRGEKRNMGKIVLAAIAFVLLPSVADAIECPDGTVLSGTTFICVARDKNGKCTQVETRENVRCIPRK
jgi:hypothetical protein